MRIAYSRDTDFTDEDFGVVDLGAEKSSSHLRGIYYEDLLIQNLIYIRNTLKTGDTIKLISLLDLLTASLHTYFNDNDRTEIALLELQNKQDINFFKTNISEQNVMHRLYDITLNNYAMNVLDVLIRVIKRNGFLYESDLYLKLLFNYYSDVQRTVMFQTKGMMFKSILMLRVLVNPYYDKSELFKEEMANIRKNIFLIHSRRDSTPTECLNLTNTMIERIAMKMFTDINLLMDKRGLLGQRTEEVDLSLANFDIPLEEQTINQKVATTIVKDIKDRLTKYDQNWLSVVVGQTGSGKSTCALALAEMIDPTFNASRVAYSFDEFMQLITNEKDGESKGKAIVWDEAGVGIDNRKWASKVNILVNKILQTFRHDNYAVIFTVPDPSFVDSKTRILFHNIIETKNILRESQKVKTSWLEVKRNVAQDKVFAYHPKVMAEGRIFKIRSILIPKPSAKLLNAYVRTSNKFKTDLKEEAKEELKESKMKSSRMDMSTFNKTLKQLMQEDPTRYSTVKKGKYFFSDDLLKFNLNVSQRDAKKLKVELEKIYNEN